MSTPTPDLTLVVPDLGPSGPVRTIGARTFDFSRQVAIMAIVNRTRDSFYDNGSTFDFGPALRRVEEAVEQGADWVDIGGVPFSPIAGPVSEQEEVERVVPLVEATRGVTDAVISVDTFRAAVAREALRAGADAINDTSGLHDPTMARLAQEQGGTLIVCHSKAAPLTKLPSPQYEDVVTEVRGVLADRVQLALAQGLAPERIVVDPGHDLNKNTFHSLEITRRLGELATLGYPLLAAVSNKDFIQETLDLPKERLLAGTTATHVFCILQGARILRVHDVAGAVHAARMTESILGWRPPARTGHNL
ncbi:dihydropteroate synthase [Angustibacter luteus]|uniref:Dihydropteroate synthase n=1 Tax=Angustibacter luteus TaxID=658456 RepID=A0ABW1JF95_9ACTN